MPWRVPLRYPIYTVFGANTGVGKTIISTLLVKALAPEVAYIKPVSTGPLIEADYLHVDRFTGVTGEVLYQYQTPCSPHLAAGSDAPVDSEVLAKLLASLRKKDTTTIVESAGGVHSPTPSGTSQLELYRALRLPVILVADSNLGGISTTISAFESLRLHGFDVEAIIGFRSDWGNLPYLASKLSQVPTIQVPPPPARHQDIKEDEASMHVYYDMVSKSAALNKVKQVLHDAHTSRLQRLESMPDKALQHLWYPFTQHAHLSPPVITTIDSALNDDFACYDSSNKSLRPVFDGSASWWTQGLGHGNSDLALEAAYAASRYGHIILPSAVNEPALALAESLLESIGKGWASRVYYSDNGATGIEIALKMALKASRVRYNDTKDALKLGVIGFTGSYHGDTIGAMDASDPNVYNAEVDWYDPKGLFFDPPSVKLQKGEWLIESESGQEKFATLSAVFDLESRTASHLAIKYEALITRTIEEAVAKGQRFGALLFEPVLLGAAGMVFVDPLFQALLVKVVRQSSILCPDTPNGWTGLPVVTDEVFTGLYRLGVPRVSELLNFNPDISVNAKLLTGGAVPLAVTLATEEIFDVFLKDDKKDALLHGHSYTAHPVGTSVALRSVADLQRIYDPAQADILPAAATVANTARDWSNEGLPSIWSRDYVHQLSHHDRIDGVVCLGSVLAITLKVSAEDAGYNSMAAARVLQKLRQGTEDLGGVMARPLGNVMYFMASQVTTRETADRIQSLIEHALT